AITTPHRSGHICWPHEAGLKGRDELDLPGYAGALVAEHPLKAVGIGHTVANGRVDDLIWPTDDDAGMAKHPAPAVEHDITRLWLLDLVTARQNPLEVALLIAVQHEVWPIV